MRLPPNHLRVAGSIPSAKDTLATIEKGGNQDFAQITLEKGGTPFAPKAEPSSATLAMPLAALRAALGDGPSQKGMCSISLGSCERIGHAHQEAPSAVLPPVMVRAERRGKRRGISPYFPLSVHEVDGFSAKFAALTVSDDKAEKNHPCDMVDTDLDKRPRPSSRTLAYG